MKKQFRQHAKSEMKYTSPFRKNKCEIKGVSGKTKNRARSRKAVEARKKTATHDKLSKIAVEENRPLKQNLWSL